MLLTDCRRLTELTTEYHEGTMTLWQRLNYYVHAAMCPPCRNYRDQLRLAAESAHRAAEVEDDLMNRQGSPTPSDAMRAKLAELRQGGAASAEAASAEDD